MQNQSILEPTRVSPKEPMSNFGTYIGTYRNEKELLGNGDDTYLVQACLEGNETAWEELLERYGRLIYTVPLRFDFPHHLADEIYQEVCVILLRKLHTLKDQSCLQSWLVTVTKRVCLQYRQHTFLTTSLDTMIETIIADDEGIEQILLNAEYEDVRTAIAALEPRCQQLLSALFFEDSPRSYAEIAQTLGIPSGSIGPTRGRCLDRLNEEIAKIEAQDLNDARSRSKLF